MHRAWSLGLVAAMVGCRHPAAPHESPEPPREPERPAPVGAPSSSSPVSWAPLPADAGAPDAMADDAMAIHLAGRDELLALAAGPDAGTPLPRALREGIAPVAGRFNQGNKAIAKHSIGPRACEKALEGVVLQTPEQKAECKGHENMVPIYRGGDAAKAKACIDVFEYPNRACELPFVWGTPAEADQICRSEGKRLCSQGEWDLACAGDPGGGPDRTYAYGDKLDLAVCNTQKPHPFAPNGETWLCVPQNAETTWRTCATETEPAGAFPQCRSRFGVYDLHGNVAEMMTRQGDNGEVLTQLKGSAFFYVDVAREPGVPQKAGGRETYPDHCGFDPRWHVEKLTEALHSNYHLGFRCCLGL